MAGLVLAVLLVDFLVSPTYLQRDPLLLLVPGVVGLAVGLAAEWVWPVSSQ